jgi:hypothetical protein
MSFQITIDGVARDERRRILGLIGAALKADMRYIYRSGKYPFEGSQSSETYAPIDPAKIYPDMSVEACAARYNAERDSVLASIRDGRVSAIMSGIEHMPEWFEDLGDDMEIETAMTWNGQYHIERPTWRAEYDAWRGERGKGE